MIVAKKKIAIIGPGLKMGGMERASCNFANSLDELGYEVVYISMFNQKVFFTLNAGVKYVAPMGFNSSSLNFLKTLKFLRKTIKIEKPDSVFVLSKFYSAIALLALAFTKTPVFISERSSPFYKWPKKIDVFNHWVFKNLPPTGVIAQTSTAEKFQKRYHKSTVKFQVIPNPVREIREVTAVKKNYILAMGRFNDPNKGFDRLIEAFATVNAPEWKLVFAGGNEEGVALKAQAEKLNILDRIIFLGKVDVDEILAESKIFVIPSRSEGFPNALCEAMAAGLACIAFDFNSGPRDIITPNHDGIIVEDNNIPKLTEAINDLVADENQRNFLGANAQKIKVRLHSHTIGKQLANFILE